MRRVVLVYAGAGFVLWTVPLFNLLHAESSAVIALVAFFTAGLSSLPRFEEGEALGGVLVRQEAALLVPWLLLTVTLLWVPNCGYGQGLLFYLLFPPVSVALAVALAYAISGTRRRFRRTIFAGVGLSVVLLTPLYDLGLHPQFYVYNHVFGGVLGPIYDEELAIRPGLLYFRGLTLLWAAWCLLLGRRLRRRKGTGEWGVRAGLAALTLCIGACYLFADRLGFNATSRTIEQALGGVLHTEHFDIFYDPASLDEDDLAVLAADHEYRYAGLAEGLGIGVPARIASYLYPDADTRARLTGARYTNVAPVWLRRPQVHVLAEVYYQVFPHELAHVFSREFGLPGLRASLAVGLVEGFAVAMEPPDGLPTPHEQVSVVLTQRLVAGEQASAPAEALSAHLSPMGFWTGRGAVSYTTMGSFVRYLIDAYGPERFEQVYARADFEEVYGKTGAALAHEWQAFIGRLSVVDRSAGDLVARRFAVPSLFEKRCPHYVPPYLRAYRKATAALTAQDTTGALAGLETSLREQPVYEPALAAWARLKLAGGRADAVLARLDTLAPGLSTPLLSMLLGDAWALTGHPGEALARYEAALKGLPGYAHEPAALLILRKTLAARPDLLRLLTSGASYEDRARRLDAFRAETPAAGLTASLLWAEAGRFEEAAERLRATPVPDDERWPPERRERLRRQRLAWLAQWYYRAGAPERAARYAEQAVRAYDQAGDFNTAARWRDYAAQIAWTRGDGPEQASSGFLP